MQKIILLVGDSGCGKDFVLSIANEYPELSVVKRYISRGPREGEEPSISANFQTPIEEIRKMDYFYEGAEAGRWYGIRKDDLEEVLNSGKSPIVICPNYENLLQMTGDFPGMVVPYFIYRGYGDSTLELWKKSLIDRGSSQEEIEKREKKKDKYFRELYIEHYLQYSSNVILNLHGVTTKDDIKKQLEGLCEKNEITITPSAKSGVQFCKNHDN